MRTKTVALLLALMLLVSGCFSTAAGEELDISITADKEAYTGDELVTLTVLVTNNTGGIVRRLRISNELPAGLAYVDDADANRFIDELQPGEKVQYWIRARKIMVEAPATGDASRPALWVALLLAAALYLVYQQRRTRVS